MAYNEFVYPVPLLQCWQWTKLTDLLSILTSQRNIQFSVKANRDAARVALLSVVKPAPFDYGERFPNKYHVNLNHPTISKLWMQILNSLDLNTRAEERGKFNIETEAKLISNSDDARMSFVNSVVAFINLLMDCSAYNVNGIYAKDTFEANFELVWVEREIG